ncbi:MAG: hypothetical protein LBK41_05780 [Clostridiales bacterium]|jgi:hypothetical protein|nr:hypothetical protein [Clostridiales bacterium]
MKKRITAAVIGVSVTLALALIPARAFYEAYRLDGLLRIQKFDRYTDLYDAQTELLNAQIKSLENQLSGVNKPENYPQERYQIDDLKSRLELVPTRLEEAKERAKYELQARYNGVCLMLKQNELLQAQLEYLDAQITVENTKLSLGDSTRASLDALAVQKASAEQAIGANLEIIKLTKALVASAAGFDGEGFNPTFELPLTVELPYPRTLDFLWDRFMVKNVAANESRMAVKNNQNLAGYIGEAESGISEYVKNAAEANLKAAQAQNKLTGLQLRQSATGVFARYLSAKAGYNPNYNGVLTARLALAESAREHGEVSGLEFLRLRAEIQEQMYGHYESVVTLLNAVTELQMLERGVLADGGG